MHDRVEHFIALTENRMSNTNQKNASTVLTILGNQQLINENSLISRDTDNGIVIRWPSFRVSCEIADDMIFVTSVPEKACNLDEVLVKEYSPSDIAEACAHIGELLGNAKT